MKNWRKKVIKNTKEEHIKSTTNGGLIIIGMTLKNRERVKTMRGKSLKENEKCYERQKSVCVRERERERER